MISRRRGPRILAALALTSLLFSALPATSAGASAAPAHAAPAEADAPGDAIWSWPVQPRPEVTRLFDLEHRYSAGHRGIDLAVPAGTAVYAPDDGTVHFVGWVVNRPLVSVQHANGIRSTFEPVDAAVAEGDTVTRGQLIGHVADSPAHEPSGGLHLGARLGDDYLDPLALLGEVPRAILLPISP
jgi:murein DD-endopeptidase MepM/ murein hydrolase activator NlpD